MARVIVIVILGFSSLLFLADHFAPPTEPSYWDLYKTGEFRTQEKSLFGWQLFAGLGLAAVVIGIVFWDREGTKRDFKTIIAKLDSIKPHRTTKEIQEDIERLKQLTEEERAKQQLEAVKRGELPRPPEPPPKANDPWFKQ